MRVAVGGSNGFTGRYVCSELLKRGFKPIALIRPGTDPRWMEENLIEYRYTDLNVKHDVERCCSDVDAFISTASLGFHSCNDLISGLHNAGVKRCIFTSTTGIYTKLQPASKRIRMDNESLIMDSSLDYTIVRPTMIYGSRRDRNMWRLLLLIKKWKIIPVIGDGKGLMRPVYVRDVAWALVEVIERKRTSRMSYNLSGKYALTYRSVIEHASDAIYSRVILVRIPIIAVKAMLKIAGRLGLKTPITLEQVDRLDEDKDFDHEDARTDFGFHPLSFEEGIRILGSKFIAYESTL